MCFHMFRYENADICPVNIYNAYACQGKLKYTKYKCLYGKTYILFGNNMDYEYIRSQMKIDNTYSITFMDCGNINVVIKLIN